MKYDFELYPQGYEDLLPGYSKPLPGEVLMSWINRLSCDHFISSWTLWNRLWKDIKNNFLCLDVDRHVSKMFLENLAKRTNCTFEEAANTVLSSYDGIIFSGFAKNGTNKWLLPASRRAGRDRKNSMLYCSRCLCKNGERPYYKKIWRLSLSVVCTDCGCYLHDCCFNCRSPITLIRHLRVNHISNNFMDMLLCSECKTDLREAPVESAPDLLIEMQKHLYSIMDNGWNEKAFYPHQYFDVLAQIIKLLLSKCPRLIDLQKDIHKELLFNYEPPLGRFENCFENNPLADRIPMLMMGYWLLEEWPERFIYFFRKNNLWSSDILKDFSDAPYWFEDQIISSFYQSNVNRRFKLISLPETNS